MDRLAAHVIATAALTVTLATVPVLFADASHAASSPVPASLTAATSPVRTDDARTGARTAGAALPALPPLAAEAQTETGAPAPAEAETAPSRTAAPGPVPAGHGVPLAKSGTHCADIRQVGRTAHARYHGMIAFSVKQFYSPACHSYYGYTYAWLQFRKLHVRYDVGAAVFDATHDAIDAARTYLGGDGGPGFWSAAFPAANRECTQGEGHYFYYPASAPGGFEEGDTLSPKVCA